MIIIEKENQVIVGNRMVISTQMDEEQMLELMYKDMLARGIVIQGRVVKNDKKKYA